MNRGPGICVAWLLLSFVARADEIDADVTIPTNLHNSNVLFEVSGAGVTRSRAYFSNSLQVEDSESYGQLRVLEEESGQALDTVYVKVYARLANGQVPFYEDGYTDRRGRFDYASHSSDDSGRRRALRDSNPERDPWRDGPRSRTACAMRKGASRGRAT